MHLVTRKVVHADGAADMGLFGVSGQNDLWGITSMDVTVTGREIVADLPGETVAHLVREWSRSDVRALALFGPDTERPLADLNLPGLGEAADESLP